MRGTRVYFPEASVSGTWPAESRAYLRRSEAFRAGRRDGGASARDFQFALSCQVLP